MSANVENMPLTEVEKAFRSELNYWRKLANGHNSKPGSQEAFLRRVRGERVFMKELLGLIDTSKKEIELLDVGAGPCSNLGTGGLQNVDLSINITGIDPLADGYNKILEECGLTPAFPTIYGLGEKLSSFVKADKYDVVYCKNALDHVQDPHATLLEMKKVVAPNGFIYLMGRVNEAVHQDYHQLHQWNMLPCENDLIVWDKNEAFSVKRMFGDDAVIKSQHVTVKNLVSDEDHMYHVQIQMKR